MAIKRDQHAAHRGQAANCLLDVMPPYALDRLLAGSAYVSLPVASRLGEPGHALQYMYFPERGLASFSTPFRRAAPIAIGVVGRWGMVGLGAFLDQDGPQDHAAVQIPLQAWRVPRELLKEVAGADPTVDRLLLRYAAARQAELQQSIVCAARHPVDGRLARWLLTIQDQTGAGTLLLTQQVLGSLVQVSRQRLNEAATGLRERGLIDYVRGRVAIVGRADLEAVACECYAAIRGAFERVYAL